MSNILFFKHFLFVCLNVFCDKSISVEGRYFPKMLVKTQLIDKKHSKYICMLYKPQFYLYIEKIRYVS